jgi:uncharacterized DUF497 family protein
MEFHSFEWDEAKRQSNIQKHGIDFEDAVLALEEPHLEIRTERNGEVRTLAICPASTKVITVIYMMRDEKCRIISARAARKNEQRAYHDSYGG